MKKIAIIEDETAIRENYMEMLGAQGYQVSGYSDRITAESAFKDYIKKLKKQTARVPRGPSLFYYLQPKSATDALPPVVAASPAAPGPTRLPSLSQISTYQL